jgi:hypothetical protein
MTQAVYSSAQVAKMLGVSGGMVRRYAMALEELTGEPIPQHARDGRQFTQEHVDALVSARRFVAGRQGMSVETGLRLALGLTDLPAATLSPTATTSGTVDVEALKAALGEVIGPLLTRLQTVAESNAQLTESNARLTAEVAALRSEVAGLKVLPASERPASVEERQRDVEVVNGIEPQKLEQESWMAAVALKALTAASELPATPRERRGGESTGDAEGASDGPMVRVARWLERRLYGGKGN